VRATPMAGSMKSREFGFNDYVRPPMDFTGARLLAATAGYWARVRGYWDGSWRRRRGAPEDPGRWHGDDRAAVHPGRGRAGGPRSTRARSARCSPPGSKRRRPRTERQGSGVRAAAIAPLRGLIP
jgi:hypothetical protein